MGVSAFIVEYLFWHYGEGIRDFLRVAGNLLWGVYHFFSVPLLLRTLFSPWRRLKEEKKRPGFDAEEFFGDFIVNLLMRVVGVMVRAAVLLIAFVALALLFAVGIGAFFMWLLFPMIIVVSFLFGVSLIARL